MESKPERSKGEAGAEASSTRSVEALEGVAGEVWRAFDGLRDEILSDLRGISFLRGLLESTLEKPTDAQRGALDGQLARIRRATALLDEAARTLPSFGRAPEPQDVDLESIARSAWSDASDFRNQGSVRLEMGEGLVLRTDSGRLRFVLARLMMAAAESAPEGGAVRAGGADDAVFVESEGSDLDRFGRAQMSLMRLDPRVEVNPTCIVLLEAAREARRLGARLWEAEGPSGGAAFWLALESTPEREGDGHTAEVP